MKPLTTKQLAHLRRVGYAMEHFDGFGTNRQTRLRDMLALERRGLVRAPCLAHPCDDDDSVNENRKPGLCWVLTLSGLGEICRAGMLSDSDAEGACAAIDDMNERFPLNLM